MRPMVSLVNRSWPPLRALAGVAGRMGHAGGNAHKTARLDHARFVTDPHRQRSLEHIEHVVQTLVSMRWRAREPRCDRRLREKERPTRIGPGGFDHDCRAGAGAVPLAITRTMHDGVGHRSDDGVSLAGVGIGLASASATRIGTDVPPHRRDTGAGLLNTAAQLGSAVGTAALLCLSEATTGASLPLSGPRLGWLAAAMLALTGAAARGGPPPGPQRSLRRPVDHEHRARSSKPNAPQ